MDKTDIKILSLLQDSANLSASDIADKVGLSTTPCWRRIQNLEQEGVIERKVTLLNRDKLNLGVTVIVGLRTSRHDVDWFEEFSTIVDGIPEVIEFYRMSGTLDYLLKVVVPNISAFDLIYKQLITVGGLLDVTSNFAMEEIKSTTVLPLRYIK